MTTEEIFTKLLTGDLEFADAARELGCQPYVLEAWLNLTEFALADYTPEEVDLIAASWDEGMERN